MKLLKRVILTLLFLVIITTGVVAIAPALLVVPLLSFYLNDLGIQVVDLEQLQIGSESISADSVRLENQQASISIAGIEAQYLPSELLRGNLTSLSIQQLDILLHATDTNNTRPTNTPPLTELLQVFERIPIEKITITDARIESATAQIDFHLDIQSDPTRITAGISLGQESGWTIEFSAEQMAQIIARCLKVIRVVPAGCPH